MRELKISADKITKRSDNTSRYFNDVEKNKMLGADEEFEIAVRAQQGDEEAIEKLINSNLRFVVSVAKQYSNTRISLDELICQGNIGLCYSARTFDPTRGFKFISYAVWHIRKEILHYLTHDSKTVRVPQNVYNDLSAIKKADQLIQQYEGRPGTPVELQEMLELSGKTLSIDQIKRTISSEAGSIHLESSDIEDAHSPIDWLSSDKLTDELVEMNDYQKTVAVLLKSLNSVQSDIVVRRLGLISNEPESFASIAHSYERTTVWARLLYTKSLKIMKARTRKARRTEEQIINCEI